MTLTAKNDSKEFVPSFVKFHSRFLWPLVLHEPEGRGYGKFLGGRGQKISEKMSFFCQTF